MPSTHGTVTVSALFLNVARQLCRHCNEITGSVSECGTVKPVWGFVWWSACSVGNDWTLWPPREDIKVLWMFLNHRQPCNPEYRIWTVQQLHPAPFYYLLLNKYIHSTPLHFHWHCSTSAEEEYKSKWSRPGFHEAESDRRRAGVSHFISKQQLEELMIRSASAVLFLQAIGSRANNPWAWSRPGTQSLWRAE